MAEKITSRSNPLVKKFRAVLAGKDKERILLEGTRLLEEALKSNFPLEEILHTEELADRPGGKNLLSELAKTECRLIPATEEVVYAVSDVETSQGIAALARRPRWSLDDIADKGTLLIGIEISDPGNAGALMRTASASGVGGMILTPGSASAFHPRTIRGSMGASLRLPVVEGMGPVPALEALKKAGRRIAVADASGGKPYTDVHLGEPIALVLGGEARGIPEPVRQLADEIVTIPMNPEVESLNVAAAGAVLLFEIARSKNS